jgi:hypothetical protein
MLLRLSALVAQPMKIVVGSNPDPSSGGSQFGAAGRAEDGGVIVVVVLGAVIDGGLAVVAGVVDTEVLDERGTFCGLPPHPVRNTSATRQQIPTIDLTNPLCRDQALAGRSPSRCGVSPYDVLPTTLTGYSIWQMAFPTNKDR